MIASFLFLTIFQVLFLNIGSILDGVSSFFVLQADTTSAFDLTTLVAQYSALLGIAALITFLINIGKTFGFIKDGTASIWSAGANLVGLILLFLLRVFRPEFDIVGLDANVAQVVNVAMVVLGYILQLLGSKGSHFAVKGIPVIGKSYELEALNKGDA